MRLVSAKLSVKFQLDCSSIKEKIRMACVDDTPYSRPDLPPDRHNSLHNDRMFVKLCQNVRLVSTKLSVKFQLDCSSIKEKIRMACVDDTPSSRPDLPPDRHNSLRDNRIVVKLGQNVRLASANVPVKISAR